MKNSIRIALLLPALLFVCLSVACAPATDTRVPGTAFSGTSDQWPDDIETTPRTIQIGPYGVRKPTVTEQMNADYINREVQDWATLERMGQ